jgi:hypothetical protein
MTERYDASNEEIYHKFIVECNGDVLKLWRLAVASVEQHYHLKAPGIISNTDDGHYVVMD